MLECRSLCVSYGKNAPLLRGLSFTAPSGAITAILGENGVGKSTLFKAILQEIRYTGGVFCDGTDLSALSPRGRAARLSLLPQQLPAPALSVRETVALALAPQVSRLGAAEWERVDGQLARVGIAGLAERAVSTLSGGERQKVFLALMLTADTPVLLLDEPTAHLAPSFTARFFEILREERERGKTILLIMHDVGEALANADHVAVLSDGALAFSGTPDEALAQDIPEKHFGLTRYVAQRGEKTAVFFRAE